MASIRKRRDRKSGWIVDCRDIPGGQRRTVKTREQAEALRAKIVAEGSQDQPVAEDRNITLDSFADRWLEQRAGIVETNTFNSYRQNLSKHIRPIFGRMKLRELRRSDIKALLAKKRQNGLSKNSVRLIRATLSAMLGEAVENGVIQVNPAKGTGGGRKSPDSMWQTDRKKNVRAMTYEQLATFLAVSKARCSRREHVLFLLYADAGLRPGEGPGIQWSDFDAVTKTLCVERAVTNSGRIKTTKTGGARYVDLSLRLVGVLAALQLEQEAEALLAGRESIEPWVFIDRFGQPSRPQMVGRLFGRLVQAAELPRFVLYDLRHTYASHLLAQNADPAYVANQLGHASAATTFACYTHFFPKGDRRHVEGMERATAVAERVPITDDDTGISLDAETVNEDSWHRFGTAGEDRKTGGSEVLEFSGAEGGIRSGPLRHLPPPAGFSLILLHASSTWPLQGFGTE